MTQKMSHAKGDIETCTRLVKQDFLDQLKAYMREKKVTQSQLAKALGVSEGRISQVLNNPTNVTLLTSIKLVRALGLKMSVVGYDAEETAPHVSGEAMRAAWEAEGRPADFWDLRK